jgi:hypothetical protein
MRSSSKVFTLASVALLSCRAVLGIEEIEDGTDGGTGTPDGAADSMGTDSATQDAASETSSACAAMGNECGKCCRMAAGAAYKEELEKLITPCLCAGGSLCATKCGPNLCDGGDPKDTDCLPCMDDAIQGGTCPKERDDCAAKSPACKAAYDCLASCK